MIKPITLATLAEATASEVFNFIAHHLLTQNQVAKAGYDCKYRLGALSCAAGCLIGPGEYSARMEGHPWEDLVDDKKVPNAHMQLITELQWVHDDVHAKDDPGVWLEAIPELAAEWAIKLEPEVQALIKLRSGN